MDIDASDWYLLRDEKQLGPGDFTFLRAAAGRDGILPSDLVWRPGMTDWVSASSIVGLITPQQPTRATTQLRAVVREPKTPPRRQTFAERDNKLKLAAARAIGGNLILIALYVLAMASISSINFGSTIIGALKILPKSTTITIYVLATLCWIGFIALCWILNAILLFRRKTYFPKIFIATIIIELFGSLSRLIIDVQVMKLKLDIVDVGFILVLIAYALVLIPYALFSRRVKYTFVR